MALDKDPHSMSTQSLSKAANDPSHPMHMHAKIELKRRKGDMDEGGMKRIATTQSNKADRMASGGKKGLETFKKMSEKTLTPAEIRKRDKIAKAIKKDDPNMPMDKKMAIATATAKRVAEGKAYGPTGVSYYVPSGHKDEVNPKTGEKYPERQKSGYKNPSEQKVDEVSSKTLSNYIRKSAADAGKPRQSARTQDKRIGGQKMADDKLRKMDGKGSAAKVAATSEAKVDEISMGKMQAYGKAAAKDIEQKRNKVKAALDQPASVKHAKAGMKAMQGLTKRSRGSDMYVNKMTGRSKVKPTAESTLARIKKILNR